MKSPVDGVSDFRHLWPLSAAVCILPFVAIGPIVFFPLDGLFHIFSDSYPVIHRMHGLGLTPKLLWVASGLVAIAAIYLLTRRPLLGLLACFLFADLYIPSAMVLWGKFTFGCWVTILVVVLADVGTFMAWRTADDDHRATDV